MALFGSKSKDASGAPAAPKPPRKGLGRKKGAGDAAAPVAPAPDAPAAGGFEDFSDFSDTALSTPVAAPPPAARGTNGTTRAKVAKNGSVVGLNIGNDSIKAVEVRAKGGALSVTALGIVPTPPDALSNGVVTDVSALSGAIRDLWKTARIKNKRVVTSVAGTGALIVRVIEVPQMSDGELADNIKMDADRYIPFPPSEVVMDFKALRDLPSEGGDNMEVILAAAQREIVELHLKVLQAAKLEPLAIDVEPLCASRALLHAAGMSNAPSDYNDVWSLVNVGATSTEISVLRGDVLVFTRTVPTSGNGMTQALADAMGWSFRDAEQTKRLHTDALPPTAPQSAATGPDAGSDFGSLAWGDVSSGDASSGDAPGTFAEPGEIQGQREPGDTPAGDTPAGDTPKPDPFDFDALSNLDPAPDASASSAAAGAEAGAPGGGFDFSFAFDDEAPAATPAPTPAAPLAPQPVSATETSASADAAMVDADFAAAFDDAPPPAAPAAPAPAASFDPVSFGDIGEQGTSTPAIAVTPADAESAYDLSGLGAAGTASVGGTAAPSGSFAAAPAESGDNFDLDKLFGSAPAPATGFDAAATASADPFAAAAPSDPFATAAVSGGDAGSFDPGSFAAGTTDFGMADFGMAAAQPAVAPSQDAVLQAAIAPVLDELANEIRRSLEYHASRYPDAVVRRITLVGGGACLRNLDAYLTYALGIPTSLGDPLGGTPLQAPQLPPGYAAANGPALAVAVGLALRQFVA